MRLKLRCMYVLYMQGTAESSRFSTFQAPCGVNGRDAAISDGMEGLGSGKVWLFRLATVQYPTRPDHPFEYVRVSEASWLMPRGRGGYAYSRTIDVLDGVWSIIATTCLYRLSAATPGFVQLILQGIGGYVWPNMTSRGVVAVCLWDSNKVSTRSSRSDPSGLNG